jgi:site-specific DNA recombinase
MIKRFAYLRISKDRVGAGLGVERQRHDIEERLQRLGRPPIERYYIDNDISASDRRKNRPDYRQMLADIASGEIANDGEMDTWHTDRLHRNMTEIEEFIKVLLPTAITVDPVKTSPFDFSTAAGRMFARQMGVQAQYFAEHMGEQLKGKKEELARRGVKLGGGRPFGYTPDGMELVDAEADLIREASIYALNGGSLRNIAAAWREAGVVTSRAKTPFAPAAVREVLLRPRNAGLMQLRGKIVGVASWPPIVDADLFNALTTKLRDPSRRMNAGAVPRWLGTNLYRCGVCSHPLIVSFGGSKPHTYACRNPHRQPGERHVARNALALDALISDLAVAHLSIYAERLIPDVAVPDASIEGVRAALLAIDEKQRALAAKLAEDWTMDMVSAANEGLVKRKAELQKVLADATGSSQAAEMAQAKDVAKAWAEADLETKRSIVRELFVVTVLSQPGSTKGRWSKKATPTIDPDYIHVRWVGEDDTPTATLSA